MKKFICLMLMVACLSLCACQSKKALNPAYYSEEAFAEFIKENYYSRNEVHDKLDGL